jgi:hypothetical protein
MRNSRIIAFVLLSAVYPALVLGSSHALLQTTWARGGIFLAVGILGAVVLNPAQPGFNWPSALVAAILVYGAVYKVASFIPDISTYPFSLGWSEASRYYYASLFLPGKIYGSWTPPSVLHPSRYLMQAVPFLVTELPVWAHRAWQVFLWIAFSLATGWVLARRLSIRPWFYQGLFAAWAFLFLFQGPLYYHLLVMVILVLWGFDRRRFWRTLILVLAASAWAGISRINWLPVPGLLAAALYFLESRVGEEGAIKYLVKPAVWVSLGSILGYAVQLGYERFSGNPAEFFGSSFSSELLWYRLFPSVTYPLGVLPASVLVSLPLLLVIFSRLADRDTDLPGFAGLRSPYHPIRLLGLGAILFVLGVGGIVVSVKIGGGSNLHNIDAFLVLLLVTGSYFAFDKVARDRQNLEVVGKPSTVLASLSMIVPVLFAITAGSHLPTRNLEAAGIALGRLGESVNQVLADGGEVLFISERHLLAFHYLPAAPVVHEYEKVFLMEMAMAGNGDYFEEFYEDLNERRFDLIIADPLFPGYQGRTHSFGEENDAWVRWVVEPLLCTYREMELIPEIPLVLLAPQVEPGSCFP